MAIFAARCSMTFCAPLTARFITRLRTNQRLGAKVNHITLFFSTGD